MSEAGGGPAGQGTAPGAPGMPGAPGAMPAAGPMPTGASMPLSASMPAAGAMPTARGDAAAPGRCPSAAEPHAPQPLVDACHRADSAPTGAVPAAGPVPPTVAAPAAPAAPPAPVRSFGTGPDHAGTHSATPQPFRPCRPRSSRPAPGHLRHAAAVRLAAHLGPLGPRAPLRARRGSAAARPAGTAGPDAPSPCRCCRRNWTTVRARPRRGEPSCPACGPRACAGSSRRRPAAETAAVTQTAYAIQQPVTTGRQIAVSSIRGGAGKSTVAALLGAHLRALPRRPGARRRGRPGARHAAAPARRRDGALVGQRSGADRRAVDADART